MDFTSLTFYCNILTTSYISKYIIRTLFYLSKHIFNLLRNNHIASKIIVFPLISIPYTPPSY